MKHVAYAEKTSVSVERSRSEIETVVRKYGATHYAYVSEPGRESIQFLCRDRKIRFVLELPLITDKQFRLDGRGKVRTGQAQFAAWEQGCRHLQPNGSFSKWRVQLHENGKPIHIGVFSDEVEAAKAYDDAAKKMYGEFANLNFP